MALFSSLEILHNLYYVKTFGDNKY